MGCCGSKDEKYVPGAGDKKEVDASAISDP